MWKKILFWTLAVVLTIGASIYQRMTGPTHPQRQKITVNEAEYPLKFPRSGGEVDCPVVLKGVGVGESAVSVTVREAIQSESKAKGAIYWRKYPSEEGFTKVEMIQTPEGLSASLPVQPAAGKLEYYISVGTKATGPDGIVATDQYYFKDEPLIIRFKGDVPTWVLIPHIIFMFASMLVAAYALFCALANMSQYKKYINIAFWIILVGGFVLGPIVQKYAFDIYWSGFPFGGDLTDNKTLIAAIAMLVAVFTRKYPWGRWTTIVAVLVMFVVYSIPHSMRGSELNHESGMVTTSKTQ